MGKKNHTESQVGAWGPETGSVAGGRNGDRCRGCVRHRGVCPPLNAHRRGGSVFLPVHGQRFRPGGLGSPHEPPLRRGNGNTARRGRPRPLRPKCNRSRTSTCRLNRAASGGLNDQVSRLVQILGRRRRGSRRGPCSGCTDRRSRCLLRQGQAAPCVFRPHTRQVQHPGSRLESRRRLFRSPRHRQVSYKFRPRFSPRRRQVAQPFRSRWMRRLR